MRRTRVVVGVAALVTALAPGQADAGPPSGGAVPPPVVQRVDIAGRFGVPADAAMVAVNVTATNPAAAGFLAVYACDVARPGTSNVNYPVDRTVPNLAFSDLAADGSICVATAALTDVLVDVVGYVPAGSSITALPAPARFLDTRRPDGSPRRVPAGTTTVLPVGGIGAVPPSARTVIANITAVNGRAPGFLAVHSCGLPATTSTVNHLAGEVRANLAVVGLDAAGVMCIDNLVAVDVVVDVVAWADRGVTTLDNPVRVFDTRTDGSRLADGATATLGITGRTDVADAATAAVYNVTAVNPAGPGFVTAYPCDASRPTTSVLNYEARPATAGAAITRLSAGGTLCLYSLRSTDLVVDLVGYVDDATQFVPVLPARAFDSRLGWDTDCNLMLVDDNPNLRYVVAPIGRRDLAVPIDLPVTPGYPTQLSWDCRYVIALWTEGSLWRAPVDGGPPELLGNFDVMTGNTGMFVLRDGRVLLIGRPADGSGTARIIDTSTGAVIRQLDIDGGAFPSVTSDGRLIAYTTDAFRVMDLATGAVVLERRNLLTASVSPDGRYLAYLVVRDRRVEIDVVTLLDGAFVHRWVLPTPVETTAIVQPPAWVSNGTMQLFDWGSGATYQGTLFGGLELVVAAGTQQNLIGMR